MNFPINVYLLALLGGAAVTAASLPLWRKFCERTGIVDDPGHRKIHDKSIPLAGGLAVFTGLSIPLLCGVLVVHFGFLGTSATSALHYGFEQRVVQLLAIFGGAAGMLLLGLADDKWELKPAVKFSLQLLIALLVAAAGIRITLFIPSKLFSYFITVLWILTVTNSVNFMDNMNGLCAGLGSIAAWHFAFGAAASGDYLVALFAFLTAGALIGFLPFNFPRASAFLGDAGSHLVGFLLAVLAILPHFYSEQNPRVFSVLSPIFILALPLGDLLSVVILRWRMGQPFYIGDTNHLSHRLVRAGCSKTQAVIFIWLLSALTGLFALL